MGPSNGSTTTGKHLSGAPEPIKAGELDGSENTSPEYSRQRRFYRPCRTVPQDLPADLGPRGIIARHFFGVDHGHQIKSIDLLEVA